MYEDDSGKCNPVSSVTPTTKSLQPSSEEDQSKNPDSFIDIQTPVLNPTNSLSTPSAPTESLKGTNGNILVYMLFKNEI